MKRINVVIRAGQLVFLLLLSTFTFIIVAATEQGQTTSGAINEESTSGTASSVLTNTTVVSGDVTESKVVKVNGDELDSETVKINAAKLGKVTGKALELEEKQSIPVVEKNDDELAKEFCSSEFNVSPEKLARLHARELNDNENDENLMCYAHCFLRQVNFVNDSGVLQNDPILKEAPNEIKNKMPTVLNKCNILTEHGACRTAFAQMRCLVAEMKEIEKSYVCVMNDAAKEDLKKMVHQFLSEAKELEAMGLNSSNVELIAEQVKLLKRIPGMNSTKANFTSDPSTETKTLNSSTSRAS